jgi:hypothetical protein
VESIADLIGRTIGPEPGRTNSPIARRIEAPLPLQGTESGPHAFEIEVFNYLLANNQALGASDVWRCRNVRIDGLIDLVDGRRVAVEIKYRMNWEKACQACAQFGWYRTHVEANEKPLTSGLVIFEEFSRDWARRKPKWALESGWSFFYMDHHEVEGLRVDLLRFRYGKLESFPSALASARSTLD